jgi:hypothetical protein
MTRDIKNWSGEGTFTQVLLDHLEQIGAVEFVRVEDAPATRSDADYNFISNELFVGFKTRTEKERGRKFGVFPVTRQVVRPQMTLAGLSDALGAADGIGPPDYNDDGMMQYLRTERIVPPYQTRGYKLVELIRIYEATAKDR